MGCFEILGIEKTKDLKEIRRAYSKLLPKYSPEKEPEGFKKLRAAYEEAVSIASEEKEEEKLSPIDSFMKDFEAQYMRFEDRLDLDKWRGLLERDICFSIDSSKEVSNRILAFIMDNFNFPTEVWRLFNSYFSWTSKLESLYNDFPQNFIDFVVYKINNESTFNYEILKNCKDNRQDEFIREYRKIDDSIQSFDFYTVEKSMAVAEEICPNHPELLTLRGRYLSSSGQLSGAEKLYTNILSSNKDDINALFFRGELYFRLGRLEEAYEDYKRALEVDPDLQGVWYSLGKCCICLKKYEEAIEYLDKASRKSTYSSDIAIMLNSASNFYLESLENADLSDMKQKLKLGEAYLKALKLEESYNIASELIQEDGKSRDNHSLLCRVLRAQNKYELTYSNVCRALELFEKDYELNFLKADALCELGRYEESIYQYDKTIELNDTEPSTHNNKSYMFNKLGRYEEGLEAAKRAIELDGEYAHGYKNKAASLLGLGLYEDCLDACEEALKLYPYLTEAYEIKMKVFIDVNMPEEALGVYNKAMQYRLKDAMLYCQRARALMALERYDEAVECCDLALEIEPNNSDFYYIKGLCSYYQEDYEGAIEQFDLAIDKESKRASAYYYKAKSLLYSEREKEAMDLIESALKLELEHPERFHILRGDTLANAEKYEEALEEYYKAIKYDGNNAYYYYSVGHALSSIEKYEDAIKYSLKALELDPEHADACVNISYSYYNLGKYKECIKYSEMAIDIDPDYTIAYQNKGWALYNLENYKEAEEVCNAGLRLDGSHQNMMMLKVRIFEAREMYHEAALVCDRILELDEDNPKVKALKKEFLDKADKAKGKGLFGKIFR